MAALWPRRGRALKDLIVYLFELVPGIIFTQRNALNACTASEIGPATRRSTTARCRDRGRAANVDVMVVLTLSRDVWDWLALWSTVAAAALAALAVGFAAWAIRRGNAIARNADQALVRERRMTFELGVLVRLVEICGLSPPGSLQVARGLLKVLPAAELPGMRDAIGRGVVPSNDLLDTYWEEYTQAVQRRLHPPSVTGAQPRGQSRWARLRAARRGER